MKKSASDVKQKDMKLFESKIDSNQSKKVSGVFDDKYTEYKSKGVEGPSMQQCHESIRPYLSDMIKFFEKSS